MLGGQLTVPESHFAGEAAVNAVGMLMSELKWLWRPQGPSDFGIDAHAELVKNGTPTGRLVALQIKGGKSFVEEKTDDSFIFRGEERHLSYWIGHSLPVVVVIYDIDSHSAYWQAVTKETAISTGKGWKIAIPFEQRLDEASSDRLVDIASSGSASPYELRFRYLKESKQLLEAADHPVGRLLLEAQEWVNKSSGRGDLRLILESGKVGAADDVLVDWRMYFFPGVDFGEALEAAFPWGTLQIDESYYQMFDEDRWKEDSGIWDSETGDYILFESYSDWAADNLPQGLRPYEDNGEIASWRLEIQPNELGKAFLQVDEFLSEE